MVVKVTAVRARETNGHHGRVRSGAEDEGKKDVRESERLHCKIYNEVINE